MYLGRIIIGKKQLKGLEKFWEYHWAFFDDAIPVK